jgi:hypothetical protein
LPNIGPWGMKPYHCGRSVARTRQFGGSASGPGEGTVPAEETLMRPLCVVALILSISHPSSAPAAAPDKKDKDRRGEARSAEAFSDSDREKVRLYFVEEHGRGNCPPGLVKKNNRCFAPGQAKKRYEVGRALPMGVVMDEPPSDLSVRMGAPPPGYRYVIVDGDVLKLVAGTMLVVDAIEVSAK